MLLRGVHARPPLRHQAGVLRRAEGRLGEIIGLLARFCIQSDLANAEGVDYVLTMDADAMLVEDLQVQLGHRMLGGRVGLVTFAEWSSQAVLWRRDVLHDFCDVLVAQFKPDADPMVCVCAERAGVAQPALSACSAC